MRIISNDKLIKRNGRIGNITSLASIVVLGAGMVLSFTDKDGSKIPYTFAALIVGFLMFQVGNFFMSKWGKSPRPDELISSALKGLDDKYTLYHYTTPVSHLLVGPSGVHCLVPLNQAGEITYDELRQRWKHKGGNFFMKTFGGESLGRPENEVRYTLGDAAKLLKDKSISIDPFVPEAVLVFTNPKAELSGEDSPVQALQAAKLKEFIRKKAKEKLFPVNLIKQFEEKVG
ncbi:MAG TPA: hypothetical protein PK040_01030 [Anaerolineaceae bacterium]|nr:hypothetical protein [Anaerolineaceae bacterium]